jgi:hypothetical protein
MEVWFGFGGMLIWMWMDLDVNEIECRWMGMELEGCLRG